MDQHCVDGRGTGGGGRLGLSDLVLAVVSSPASNGVCRELKDPRVRVVSTMKRFGEQSHPSRRTGCIKRSTQQCSKYTEQRRGGPRPGAVPADEQQDHRRRQLTDVGPHTTRGHPCARCPLAPRRSTLSDSSATVPA